MLPPWDFQATGIHSHYGHNHEEKRQFTVLKPVNCCFTIFRSQHNIRKRFTPDVLSWEHYGINASNLQIRLRWPDFAQTFSHHDEHWACMLYGCYSVLLFLYDLFILILFFGQWVPTVGWRKIIGGFLAWDDAVTKLPFKSAACVL